MERVALTPTVSSKSKMTCKSSLEKKRYLAKATTLKHQIALPVIHKAVAWIINFYLLPTLPLA
jgi:hypothetical protein